MDFGLFPPEFNSARMYAGPGSAPMLAAAAAWNALAAELHSTAGSYRSVISGLTGEGWTGPASASMAAAAAPYAAWMTTTAAQAEQTAAQATAAAGTYETAFGMTVPPPVVAANRARLASLVASNVLGQNTPAIAATEAHYGEMWAQDATAMYGYAANSAVASKVTPFTAPQQTTNPAGLVAQGAAAAQAAGTSASSGVQSTLSQMVSAVPNTLQGLASPLQSAPSSSALSAIGAPLGLQSGDVSNAMTNLMSSSFSPMGLAGITQAGADIAVMRGAAIAAGHPLALGGLDGLAPLLPGSGMGALGPAGVGGAGVAAGMGRATSIGPLSVPQSWAAAVPVANSTVAPFPASGWTTAVPEAEPGGMPGMPGMPMAGSPGRGFGFSAPRYGFKPTVMARPVG